MTQKFISPQVAAKLMEVMLKSGALSCMTIDGTSMEPFIKNGSKVIVDHRAASFETGDIILFEREISETTDETCLHGENCTKSRIQSYIHRIVEIKGDLFITKGDNRFTFDESIKSDNIKGKVTSIEQEDSEKLFINEEPWRTIGKNTAYLSRKTGLLHSQLFAEHCPGDAEALHNKAFTFYLEGRKDEALDFFRKALALDPDRALSRVDIGEILRQMGKPEEALIHLRLAIESDKRKTEISAQAYNITGNTLFDMGRIRESLEEYSSSISIDPHFVPPYINRAWAHLENGSIEEAQKDLEKALSIEPENFKALKCLGLLLLRSDHIDEAFQMLEKASHQREDDADVLNNLGIIHMKKSENEQAREMFERARTVKPEHFDSCYNLGLLLESIEELEEAKEIFRDLQRQFPDHEGLKEKAIYLTCKIKKDK